MHSIRPTISKKRKGKNFNSDKLQHNLLAHPHIIYNQADRTAFPSIYRATMVQGRCRGRTLLPSHWVLRLLLCVFILFWKMSVSTAEQSGKFKIIIIEIKQKSLSASSNLSRYQIWKKFSASTSTSTRQALH